jgi:hypothetical protein
VGLFTERRYETRTMIEDITVSELMLPLPLAWSG